MFSLRYLWGVCVQCAFADSNDCQLYVLILVVSIDQALAALIGVFLGLTLAILVVAISGSLFLWLHGSFWTTVLVVFLGGCSFFIF